MKFRSLWTLEHDACKEREARWCTKVCLGQFLGFEAWEPDDNVVFNCLAVLLKSTITSIIVIQSNIRHPIQHPEADDDSIV